MAHHVSYDRIQKVLSCFETTKEIWTQKDIREITGFNEPTVSTALTKLEQSGRICWVRNEGIPQIKFYQRLK